MKRHLNVNNNTYIQKRDYNDDDAIKRPRQTSQDDEKSFNYCCINIYKKKIRCSHSHILKTFYIYKICI